MEMCKSFRLVDLRLGFTFSRIRSSSECRLLRGRHGSAFSPLPALCFSAEMFVNSNPPFTYMDPPGVGRPCPDQERQAWPQVPLRGSSRDPEPSSSPPALTVSRKCPTCKPEQLLVNPIFQSICFPVQLLTVSFCISRPFSL